MDFGSFLFAKPDGFTNPIVFDDLKDNVCQFTNQKAYNFLLYDEDNKEVNFNISFPN